MTASVQSGTQRTQRRGTRGRPSSASGSRLALDSTVDVGWVRWPRLLRGVKVRVGAGAVAERGAGGSATTAGGAAATPALPAAVAACGLAGGGAYAARP